MVAMSEERFQELVSAAFAAIPGELVALLDNVALFIEDESPPGEPELLGLYEGVPLTERGASYGGHLPDRIRVFRNPVLRRCATEAEVVREVEVTVAHELAHHFGIDDARLHDLGYA